MCSWATDHEKYFAIKFNVHTKSKRIFAENKKERNWNRFGISLSLNFAWIDPQFRKITADGVGEISFRCARQTLWQITKLKCIYTGYYLPQLFCDTWYGFFSGLHQRDSDLVWNSIFFSSLFSKKKTKMRNTVTLSIIQSIMQMQHMRYE